MNKIYTITLIIIMVSPSQSLYPMKQAITNFIAAVLEKDITTSDTTSNLSTQEKLISPSSSNSSLFADLSNSSSEDNQQRYSNFLNTKKIDSDLERQLRSSNIDGAVHQNKRCKRTTTCLTIACGVTATGIATLLYFTLNK